jgi:hypothetical protein
MCSNLLHDFLQSLPECVELVVDRAPATKQPPMILVKAPRPKKENRRSIPPRRARQDSIPRMPSQRIGLPCFDSCRTPTSSHQDPPRMPRRRPSLGNESNATTGDKQDYQSKNASKPKKRLTLAQATSTLLDRTTLRRSMINASTA